MSILGIFDLLCRDLHKSEIEATISKKATNPEVISGSKSNSVVLVKSPMGSASAFPFLCY